MDRRGVTSATGTSLDVAGLSQEIMPSGTMLTGLRILLLMAFLAIYWREFALLALGVWLVASPWILASPAWCRHENTHRCGLIVAYLGGLELWKGL